MIGLYELLVCILVALLGCISGAVLIFIWLGLHQGRIIHQKEYAELIAHKKKVEEWGLNNENP